MLLESGHVAERVRRSEQAERSRDPVGAGASGGWVIWITFAGSWVGVSSGISPRGPGAIPLIVGGSSTVISVQSDMRVMSRVSQALQWPSCASAKRPGSAASRSTCAAWDSPFRTRPFRHRSVEWEDDTMPGDRQWDVVDRVEQLVVFAKRLLEIHPSLGRIHQQPDGTVVVTEIRVQMLEQRLLADLVCALRVRHQSRRAPVGLGTAGFGSGSASSRMTLVTIAVPLLSLGRGSLKKKISSPSSLATCVVPYPTTHSSPPISAQSAPAGWGRSSPASAESVVPPPPAEGRTRRSAPART